jgi:DNA-binding transcriptional LysR family regulator
MELNQLETFLAVAEERSFSKARPRDCTAPSRPVSQVIRKLEASVGETALRPRRPRRLA